MSGFLHGVCVLMRIRLRVQPRLVSSLCACVCRVCMVVYVYVGTMCMCICIHKSFIWFIYNLCRQSRGYRITHTPSRRVRMFTYRVCIQ